MLRPITLFNVTICSCGSIFLLTLFSPTPLPALFPFLLMSQFKCQSTCNPFLLPGSFMPLFVI